MKQKIIKFIDGLGCMSVKEWVQLIVLALVVVNGALTMFGVNPITVSEDFLYIAISGALVIIVPFYNKWKNWNVTPEAVTAQDILDLMKMGTVSKQQVEQFIKDLKAQAAKEKWSNPTYPADGK
ncbi:phage holin [Acetobacterium wieringae]|uniref:phage holin n=1 Tax=Acetobacterium wieringae TaxID=52694 RepID=UPI0031592A44